MTLTKPIAAPDTDRADALAAAAGNSEAFERLYSKHASNVYALARWMGNPGDAEDLTQEVFLLVWRKSHTWSGSAAFATWLRRLAVNVILSHRRFRRARPDSNNSLVDDASVVDTKHSARFSPPELRLTIETAIERLQPPMRDVFVMHDVEGYTHDEIAALLAIEPGTSASRLHRARTILKEVLSDN